jgi:hypothetical protein
MAERTVGDERNKAVAEKERADDEAAISRAVIDFLQKDLLGQVDIGNQPGDRERNKDIKVREVLDRAAQGVGERFKGQALTEAAIRLTLSKAYRALGDYPEARSLPGATKAKAAPGTPRCARGHA